MEHVLGKVTGDYERSGGADALLDIVVDRRLLRDACTIEVDLPRNLSCASCEGAGCDSCGQSGAITVRERSEPPEVLRLTLPRQEFEAGMAPDSQRAILLRIQGRGGLPSSGVCPSQRGLLLLRIKVSGALSDCVREITVDPMISSSTLSKAEVVWPQENPISNVSPKIGALPPPTNNGRASHSERVNSDDWQSPQTRRSLALEAPYVQASRQKSPNAPASQTPSKPARRLGGSWQWRDAVIGLVLLLLGAAAAWYFL